MGGVCPPEGCRRATPLSVSTRVNKTRLQARSVRVYSSSSFEGDAYSVAPRACPNVSAHPECLPRYNHDVLILEYVGCCSVKNTTTPLCFGAPSLMLVVLFLVVFFDVFFLSCNALVCFCLFRAVFLMYLLQPMVNYLCKPPRRWCDKCVKRRGEVCCEGCFRVTKVRCRSVLG